MKRIIALSSLLVAGALFAQAPAPTAPEEAAQTKSLGKRIRKPSADAVALNPQPLPPKDAAALKTKIATKKGDEISLNPQPLPPKDSVRIGARKGDEVSLNPQPLPPKDGNPGKISIKRGQETALNPQPLPPKDLFVLSNGNSARIVGKQLMLVTPNGAVKASAGRYTTKDGHVIVVNANGEVTN